MPRFSIVVPAYNAEATLHETLDAIRAQTLSDWECVIVDDGSTDSTLALARARAESDSRFKAFTQQNQGTAGAYNSGVSRASGEYVVVCSADDILLPNHLAYTASFIDAEPGYDIYSTNGYFWSADGERTPAYSPEERGEVMSLVLTDVIRDCFYGVGAVYRRELFDRVGGYRLGVFGEDYDFWLRAMAEGARHRYTPEALSFHRISSVQKSASRESAFQSDIRLLTDLLHSGKLTREQRRTAREVIAFRRRLIADPQAIAPQRRRALRERIGAFAALIVGRRAP